LYLKRLTIIAVRNVERERYKVKIKDKINMAMKLYVGGLAYSVTEQELEAVFAEYGKVTSAAVIKDRDSGQSKGFGFIEMSDDAEAKAAMAALNGKDVSGRSIMVNEARPQEDRRPRDGGNFRRSY
jgi:cold-inducible RNA-binding protein